MLNTVLKSVKEHALSKFDFSIFQNLSKLLMFAYHRIHALSLYLSNIHNISLVDLGLKWNLKI